MLNFLSTVAVLGFAPFPEAPDARCSGPGAPAWLQQRQAEVHAGFNSGEISLAEEREHYDKQLLKNCALGQPSYGRCIGCHHDSDCSAGHHYCDTRGCNSCERTDGKPGSRCHDDTDCDVIAARTDAGYVSLGTGVCVSSYCTGGQPGEMCERDTDCLYGSCMTKHGAFGLSYSMCQAGLPEGRDLLAVCNPNDNRPELGIIAGCRFGLRCIANSDSPFAFQATGTCQGEATLSTTEDNSCSCDRLDECNAATCNDGGYCAFRYYSGPGSRFNDAYCTTGGDFALCNEGSLYGQCSRDDHRSKTHCVVRHVSSASGMTNSRWCTNGKIHAPCEDVPGFIASCEKGLRCSKNYPVGDEYPDFFEHVCTDGAAGIGCNYDMDCNEEAGLKCQDFDSRTEPYNPSLKRCR